ncbi:right-handed parallel beta-helix repeat-containing protein [Candidatus Pacearchaeota archaeon]|nr:right-handed parallel beta-helix repeat-containing protein [Candidatus Pacearchaeota archaeon]
MNKRGLSDIVTTVIIVLLALVAIALIWVFLRNVLFRAGEDIEEETRLFGTSFSIIDNTMRLRWNNDVLFFVERDPVGSSAAVFPVFVFEDEKDNRMAVYKYNNTPVNELERVKIDIKNKEHGFGYEESLKRILVYPATFNKAGEVITTRDPSDVYDASTFQKQVVYIDKCGTLDKENTEYRLTKDIDFIVLNSSDSQPQCFHISADDVTLDGRGHTINCLGCGITNGAVFSQGLKYAIIRNFDIRGFFGFWIQETNKSLIFNNTINNSGNDGYAGAIGVLLLGGSDNRIENNKLLESWGVGIYIGASTSFVNSTTVNNPENSVISNNFVCGNGGDLFCSNDINTIGSGNIFDTNQGCVNLNRTRGCS